MELLKDAESVMPVTTFPYPVLRSLAVDENGHIGYKWPQYATARSQDLETLYHDCGQFYACRTEAFFREGTTDTPGMVPLLLPELEAVSYTHLPLKRPYLIPAGAECSGT